MCTKPMLDQVANRMDEVGAVAHHERAAAARTFLSSSTAAYLSVAIDAWPSSDAPPARCGGRR